MYHHAAALALLAGAAAALRPAAGGGDVVSLMQLQVTMNTDDPLAELRAGLPNLALNAKGADTVDTVTNVDNANIEAEIVRLVSDDQEVQDALSELTAEELEEAQEVLADGQALVPADGDAPLPVPGSGNASGGASKQHRVALDPRKFGDLLAQAQSMGLTDSSKCCLENSSSKVRSRSHAVNRTRILEKLKGTPRANYSNDVDPEVKEEIGEMIVKVNKVLNVLMRAGHRGSHPGHLHNRVHPAHPRPGGFKLFFQSVAFFDWCLLAAFIVIFFVAYSFLLKWKQRRNYHGVTLGCWLAMAVLFGLVIWMRQGESSATLWVSGFILELIFLIENVFVFHCVISAFKLSHKALDNALFVVVGFQVAFQVVFYMGLAATLTHWNVLPYILGVWLLFVGYQAAFDDSHSEIDVMETRIVRGARWILGERLLTLDASSNFVAVDKRSGKYCLTVAGLCVVLLVVADFMLEIDVTLAKIEGLGGVKIGPELEYICFSSSAVATFTVPELYFVAREIFARLRGLKYGIALVITYLGMQMLLGTVYSVPLIVDIAIFIGVLVASGVTSIIYDSLYLDEREADSKAKMAGAFLDDNTDRNNRHTWNGVCKPGGARAADVRSALSSHAAVSTGSPKGAPEKDPEVVPEPEEDHPKPEDPDKDTFGADEEPLANETTEDTEAMTSAAVPARHVSA